MPVAPPPSTYTCPACHLSKTVAPRSDCLSAGFDYFAECPNCGHAPLKGSRPDFLQLIALQLRKLG